MPYYNTPDFTPHFLSNQNEIDLKIDHRIPKFKLKNQLNKWIDNSTVENKIHVANFFFTRCGLICPTMTQNLHIVSEAFKNDTSFMILSYSVTPWLDSTEKLNEYAINNSIDNPNWHLLTGLKSEIYDLARKGYFAEEDLGFTKDSTDFLHTEHFILVDKNSKIRGVYNGTLRTDVYALLEDIKLLKNE